MFKSLGVLLQLGMAGVGQLAAEWWSWELVGRELFLLNLARVSFGLIVFLTVNYSGGQLVSP